MKTFQFISNLNKINKEKVLKNMNIFVNNHYSNKFILL